MFLRKNKYLFIASQVHLRVRLSVAYLSFSNESSFFLLHIFGFFFRCFIQNIKYDKNYHLN